MQRMTPLFSLMKSVFLLKKRGLGLEIVKGCTLCAAFSVRMIELGDAANLSTNCVASACYMYYNQIERNEMLYVNRRCSMPNIMPISELRNYTKVVNNVKYGSRVYLTKNGYDQVTLINSKELDEIEKELATYRFMLEMEKGERSILEEGTTSSEDLKKELGI